MNAPDRFELFLLGEGEKKVTEEIDTRTPNTSIFTFNKEDHTLANMIRARLVKNPKVEFCGYKIPHPLFATFELRLQTNGEKTPKEMLIDACQTLIRSLNTLSADWTKEYELRRMVSGGGDK
ncbi:DNA-directed RNA polymerase [Calycina marina]|uniref:DNA-directed RNA polymerase n=1 Tax=Calycina marina TaxID=1763456 RepID=A0A9P8CE96_9HELO|nr:DNA-directed RNA polymerase [Calycina marina]